MYRGFSCIIRIILVAFAACCLLLPSPALAQKGNYSGVIADFMLSNTVQSSNEIASNVIRVVNHTERPVNFHFTFSIPQGWEMIGDFGKDILLVPGDSMFQPVHIVPQKLSKGGITYIVTVILLSENDIQFSAQNWYISTKSDSRWKALIPVRQVFFPSSRDSTGFHVRLQNTGNSKESIRLVLLPDRRVEILDAVTREPVLLASVIPLEVGADTMLTFTVHKRPVRNPYAGKKEEPGSHSENNEDFSVQVIARSADGQNNQSWTGIVDFSRLGNHDQLNNFSRSAVPLTFEANVYDMLSTGTTMSLEAYGSTFLGESRSLSYRFQSVYVSNFLDENSFLGTNHYIGYFSDNLNLELGEVNGWGRSLLTGKGIKGSWITGKNTFGAMYTRSPAFFNKHNSDGYGFYHRFLLPKFSLSNFLSHQGNTVLHLNTDIYNGIVTWKISKYHQVGFGGGVSMESYTPGAGLSPALRRGSGFDVNYSGGYKALSFTTGFMTGSENYTLARGVQMWNSRVTYSVNNRNNVALSMQNFHQHPTYYINGIIFHGHYTRTDRYELNWGFINPGSVIFIKPVYQVEENLSMRVHTAGTGIEYSARNLGTTRFSANMFMGYANMPDYQLPSFFISRINLFYRINQFFLSLRYFYGPGQITEQMRFLQTGINPQSIHLSGANDYWFGHGKFLLTTSSNLSYETFFKKTIFRLRPELFFYSKSGFRWSVYGSYISNAQAANPLLADIQNHPDFEKISMAELNFGFGVKKQIGVPVPGKKFCSMRVFVFKDINGNHKKDPQEEGMENMLIQIHAKNRNEENSDTNNVTTNQVENMITDEKGEIYFDNIPAGTYVIKATPLEQQSEWFDLNTLEVQVDKRQVVYLPLCRGARLNGNILIERDKYSDQVSNIDLSRIRVTAVDSSGKSYSCITERNGEFSIYLPQGLYDLSIEKSVLGSQFMFLQNKISIDLTRTTENFSITFNAVERKKKVQIKKFNNETPLK